MKRLNHFTALAIGTSLIMLVGIHPAFAQNNKGKSVRSFSQSFQTRSNSSNRVNVSRRGNRKSNVSHKFGRPSVTKQTANNRQFPSRSGRVSIGQSSQKFNKSNGKNLNFRPSLPKGTSKILTGPIVNNSRTSFGRRVIKAQPKTGNSGRFPGGIVKHPPKATDNKIIRDVRPKWGKVFEGKVGGKNLVKNPGNKIHPGIFNGKDLVVRPGKSIPPKGSIGRGKKSSIAHGLKDLLNDHVGTNPGFPKLVDGIKRPNKKHPDLGHGHHDHGHHGHHHNKLSWYLAFWLTRPIYVPPVHICPPPPVYICPPPAPIVIIDDSTDIVLGEPPVGEDGGLLPIDELAENELEDDELDSEEEVAQAETPQEGPVDLRIEYVELVDPGNPEQEFGPKYRMWIVNRGAAPVTQPFDVALLASNEPAPSEESPYGAKRVASIGAGERLTVELRLPTEVMQMGVDEEGQPTPFTYLFAAVDVQQVLKETDEENNALALARSDVPSAELLAQAN